MADTSHFTAVVEITHTQHEQVEKPNRHPREFDEKRTVREVSRIVIRADTITSLIEKANAHLELVEDYKD